MRTVPSLLGLVLVVASFVSFGAGFPSEVDVLVAGGTSEAVDMALAAKQKGKSVALVSPRPYIGQDTAGRFAFRPIPQTEELVPIKYCFVPSKDGAGIKATVVFPAPEEVTRIEVFTREVSGKSITKECHFIYSEDGIKFSSVKPLRLEMNYSPYGRFIWRSDLNRKIRMLSVGATRKDGVKGVDAYEIRVYRKCLEGTVKWPTPLEAKTLLEERLLNAGIPYLTGAMGINVLVDEAGRVSGAAFATRGGVRHVRARCTVDASVHGVLLKAAGGELTPLPPVVRLSRTVLSCVPPSAPGLKVEELPQGWDAFVQVRGKSKQENVLGRLYRCTFDWNTDDTVLGWARADMRARELTWTFGLLDAADELEIPSRNSVRDVPGLVYLPIGARLPTEFDTQLPTGKVVERKRPIPTLAECDVCVVGTGTAGAPATIAASRAGAKTIAVEYMYGMGGLGTLGMIGYYWYGTVCGFTSEVEKGIGALGAKVKGVGKREWWRRETAKAGAELVLGAMGYDVVMNGKQVVGVMVATPFGAGVIRAKVSVDATGAADLAASAGERTEFIGNGEFALQSSGLPPRVPGYTYVNSDFGYVNENDPEDVTLFGRRGRMGAKGEWDISQIIGSRERRRIIGAYQVQPEDVINERTFEDTIATGSTDFDTHGPTVAEVCFLSPATDKHVFKLNIPYRALLPHDVEGLLVCGIGASGHRDAMPFMRMQADVQNEGYAAGRAAAMAVANGGHPRAINVRTLQEHLVEIGVIPVGALTWKDNFPLSDAAWEDAIAAVGDGFKGVPLVLTDKPRAKHDLHEKFLVESDPLRKLCLAQVLGMLGDDIGADLLAKNLSRPVKEFVQVVPEGAKRFGKRMSNRDAQLVALGYARSPLAIDVILRELETMSDKTPLSRARALACASAVMASKELAPALAKVLMHKSIGGMYRTDPATLTPLGGFARTSGGAERARCTRELLMARALLLCGDCDGLARRTLEGYLSDPRGTYSAYARSVLSLP